MTEDREPQVETIEITATIRQCGACKAAMVSPVPDDWRFTVLADEAGKPIAIPHTPECGSDPQAESDEAEQAAREKLTAEAAVAGGLARRSRFMRAGYPGNGRSIDYVNGYEDAAFEAEQLFGRALEEYAYAGGKS